MKPNPKRGKYVSRSTYQKVVEENKKLLHDIKILVGDLTTGVFAVDKREVQDKWRKKFADDDYIKNLLVSVLKKQYKQLHASNPSDAKPE